MLCEGGGNESIIMPGFIVNAIGAGGGNVGGMPGKKNPQATQEYYLVFTWEIPTLFEGATDGPLIHLRDATLPTFTAEEDSILAASLNYKWAKGIRWDDIKVSWYDTQGLIGIMKKWRQSVWTQSDGLKVGGHYKKESQLDYYLPDGSGVVSWRLINSWPKVIKHGEMTYTNSEVKLVEVTIAYDWAEENQTIGSSKDRNDPYGIEDSSNPNIAMSQPFINQQIGVVGAIS